MLSRIMSPHLSFSQLVSGKELYLYLAASTTTVSEALVRSSEDDKQKPIYFMSKVLTDAKRRYTNFERITLALRTLAKKPILLSPHYNRAY